MDKSFDHTKRAKIAMNSDANAILKKSVATFAWKDAILCACKQTSVDFDPCTWSKRSREQRRTPKIYIFFSLATIDQKVLSLAAQYPAPTG